LQGYLDSPFPALRAAAAANMRQLANRQPMLVLSNGQGTLEAFLFSLLDSESEEVIRADIRATLRALLTATTATVPSRWLTLCNNVLSATSETPAAAPLSPTPNSPGFASFGPSTDAGDADDGDNDGNGDAGGGDGDDDDDDENGGGGKRDTDEGTSQALALGPSSRTILPTRWQTKVCTDVGSFKKY
jgi:hypothetical protein